MMETEQTIKSYADHVETKNHGKYHQVKNLLLVIVILATIIAYSVYGFHKYNQSNSHPQSKTIIHSISSYKVPLITACPVNEVYGSIYPFYVYFADSSTATKSLSYEYLCMTSTDEYLVSNNLVDAEFVHNVTMQNDFKYSCEELMTNEYTSKDDTSWTILNYTGNIWYQNVNCWALIPPKNATFTNLMGWGFVWIPKDNVLPHFNNIQSIDYITANEILFSTAYNVIHPDSINSWYQTTKLNKTHDRVGYSTSDFYLITPWQFGTNIISLHSTTKLEKNVYNYYETYNKLNVKSLNTLQYIRNDSTAIPQFRIGVQPHKLSADVERNELLYYSDTQEYQVYTIADFFSGIGGMISLASNVFGMIAAILLTANCLGWKGLAPYPPLSKREQVRLRRFLNDELIDL